MLIKNCKLINENNEETIKDILIDNNLFSRIEDKIENIMGHEIIDANYNYVLPGVVDIHTHMRDPGLTQKEEFKSGSMACARGGVTTFIDMPNTIPNTTTYQLLVEKKNKALGNSYVDYGFYFGGSKSDNSDEIPKITSLVAATKIFLNVSTGDMLVEDDHILEKIFRNSKIVAVHAEEEMVEKAIYLAKKTGTPLYLCHLSKASEVIQLANAKKEGLKIFGEVTPHHLFLNKEDVAKSDRSNLLLRMKPELKDKDDNDALWKGLADGTIDAIGTDHAPHLISEKLAKTTFGIPSIEHSLEMMINGVREKKISLKRLTEVMSQKPAEIMKIKNKGQIKIGYDGDLVIIDISDNSPISQDKIISKSGWTPYETKNRGAKIIATIVRGNIVYYNGNFNNNRIGVEVKYYD
ncbi:dihydroorotase [Fusobacterium sp. PH5-44]|uniref:dihydroorotase n=1 Tax=unclassified Fusobacterium TaxID=2648384 RepID=UPI003D1D6DAD